MVLVIDGKRVQADEPKDDDDDADDNTASDDDGIADGLQEETKITREGHVKYLAKAPSNEPASTPPYFGG